MTISPTASPADLSASAARRAMREGRLTALDLTRACLARIAARDTAVRAWITLNPRAEAEAAAIAPDDPRPLAGIPVAIKDVIDTADLPTTNNSPLCSTNRPGLDAPVVQILRAAGAIVLGKTDTTEFAACGRDAATGNPHDPARTPGGSSSGSAAAVADFQCPIGIGTQTGGSTIRPASFCGIPALKPSWGLISTEGVRRYAVSFDTIGLFVRDPEDLDLLADVFALPPAPPVAAGRLRLGVTLTPYADHLKPEARALFADLAARLAPVADLVPVDLPEGAADLDHLHRCIQHCEGASAFLNLSRTQGALLHREFHDRIEHRTGFTQRQHFEAYDRLAQLRLGVEAQLAQVDALIAPSAPGVAPLGRGPGNPLFNALWTALQLPVMTVPVPGQDLPLGLSLIVRRAFDRQLPDLARRLMAVL